MLGAKPTGDQAKRSTKPSSSSPHPCSRVIAPRTATVTANFTTSLLLMICLAVVEVITVAAMVIAALRGVKRFVRFAEGLVGGSSERLQRSEEHTSELQ